jgi:hypothetical protein
VAPAAAAPSMSISVFWEVSCGKLQGSSILLTRLRETIRLAQRAPVIHYVLEHIHSPGRVAQRFTA